VTKHTPGPWVVVEADEMTPLPAGVILAVHTAAEPWKKEGCICEIIAQGDGAYDSATTDANAHLIAAAPDLKRELEERTVLLREVWARLTTRFESDARMATALSSIERLLVPLASSGWESPAIAKAEGQP
jgi:hypothetical protein